MPTPYSFAPAPTRPKPGAVLAEGLTTARDAVARAARATGSGLSNDDLSSAAQDLAALASQVDALSLAVLAEAKDRGRAGPMGRDADPDPASWWGKLTGDPREVLRGGMWTAQLLKTKYDHTRRALEEGRIRLTQAKAIVRAGERAPKKLSMAQVAEVEESLVAAASGSGTRSGRPMPAEELRAHARRTFANMLPTKEESDAAEGGELEKEERRAERRAYLTLGDCGDGMWKGTFELPDLAALALKHALEKLSSPRRHGQDKAGEPVEDESADERGWSYSEHLGSAFCELLEHLPTTGWGPGSSISLLVRIDEDRLRSGLGVGLLPDGRPCSAATARRLACNAGHLPIVLSGASKPLDVGRSRRLYSRYQGYAIHEEYDTCAISGCTRPFAWCELHHLKAWSEGGKTDVADGIPLCGYHHRRAHDPEYELHRRRGPDFTLRRRT